MSHFNAQPLDAIALKHLAKDISPRIMGAKVNKIQQTNHHEIIIHFWQSKPTSTQYKFLISIRSQLSFCGIVPDDSDLNRVFPKTPLNFCVLLRKYLTGARVHNCTVLQDERVLTLTFENYNETGDNATYELIIELMGKHSNIILREAELNLILGSAHGVSEEMSRFRTLRVGDAYAPPPKQTGKKPLHTMLSQDLYALLDKQPKTAWADLLLQKYSGWGRKTVEEITTQSDNSHAVFKNVQTLQLSICPVWINTQLECLSGYHLFTNPQPEPLPPGKLNDFLMHYYLTALEALTCDEARNQLLRELNFTKQQLLKRNKSLEETHAVDYHLLKETADTLLTAGAIEHNAEQIAVAQKNYQHYKKAKNRHVMAQAESTKLHERLECIEEIILACEMTHSTEELLHYKLLAGEMDILRKPKSKPVLPLKKGKEMTSKTKPLCLPLPHENRIWIGRTGPENAYIIRHLSQDDDWWFHVPHQPGAHILLQLRTDDKAIAEQYKNIAAQCAIYYSRARQEGTSAVLMTQGKNVKSIPGSFAGHVRFKNETLQFVTLHEETIQSLIFA